MEKKIRWVECIGTKYHLLKQKPNGNWYYYGKQKSMKGIYDALKNDEYKLVLSSEVQESLEIYLEKIKKRELEYIKKKSLEAKINR